MKFTVLTSSVKEITKKIARITKKCEKYGLPYTFKTGESYELPISSKDKSSTYIFDVTDIELDVKLKHNGWNYLGTVQCKDGIIQCYFDNPEYLAKYKDTELCCDHCHKNVRRKSVVVLKHDNGEEKVVGTSCVKEFTCGLDGELILQCNDLSAFLRQKDSEIALLKRGESLDDIDFDSYAACNGSAAYSVYRVVACAYYLVKCYGYEPTMSQFATWRQIGEVYQSSTLRDEDYLGGEEAIKWILSLSKDEYMQSSYMFNLRQIVESEFCTNRHFGMLASLIVAYQRAQKEKEAKSEQVSKHVGNKGDKFEDTFIYIRSISYESRFGGGYFHFFKDDEGNVFKWSTNKSLRFNLKYNTPDGEEVNLTSYEPEQGAKLKISGSIKDHDEYRNEKQTIITRCKCEVISSTVKDHLLDKAKEDYGGTYNDNVLDNIMKDWEDSIMKGWNE